MLDAPALDPIPYNISGARSDVTDVRSNGSASDVADVGSALIGTRLDPYPISSDPTSVILGPTRLDPISATLDRTRSDPIASDPNEIGADFADYPTSPIIGSSLVGSNVTPDPISAKSDPRRPDPISSDPISSTSRRTGASLGVVDGEEEGARAPLSRQFQGGGARAPRPRRVR